MHQLISWESQWSCLEAAPRPVARGADWWPVKEGICRWFGQIRIRSQTQFGGRGNLPLICENLVCGLQSSILRSRKSKFGFANQLGEGGDWNSDSLLGEGKQLIQRNWHSRCLRGSKFEKLTLSLLEREQICCWFGRGVSLRKRRREDDFKQGKVSKWGATPSSRVSSNIFIASRQQSKDEQLDQNENIAVSSIFINILIGSIVVLDKIPAAESLYNLESIDSLAESTILIHLSTRLHGPIEEVVSIKLYRCLNTSIRIRSGA